MANTEMDENAALDKKAAKRAAKMKKKEEKKNKKNAGKKGEQNPEEEEEGGKLAVVLITLIIIVIWLGILSLLIKLDVGGFGSTLLYPVLKDVPYINKILPETETEKKKEEEVVDVQYPYATVEEAIARIKELEMELSDAKKASDGNSDTIAQLQAEVERLKVFETERAAFQEEKTKYYDQVVFSEQAPDIEEYKTWYESIDAANAAELYKQVVQQVAYNDELEEYAKTYASMKPKQAAAIMEQMTDELSLVAEILGYMDVESRGDILGAMDSQIAAKVTKLMKPKEP